MRLNLEHIASLLFNQPHMIEPGKLEVILRVLAPRLGLEGIPIQLQGENSEKMEYPALHGAAGQKKANYIDVGSGVGVLPISGTLVHRAGFVEAMSGLTSYAQLSADFHAMMNDSSIEHVVLNIDSAGGSVNGAFDFSDEIFKARGQKPITAIIDESAFSAAYLLASAADEIVVNRTGGVGSIGIIAVHVDRSKMNEQIGLTVTPVFAGARKADMNSNAPLSDEARDILQAHVDEAYSMFVDTVARNRGISTQEVRNTEAAVYFGSHGISSRLADRLEAPRPALQGIVARYRQPAGQANNGRMQRAARAMSIRSAG